MLHVDEKSFSKEFTDPSISTKDDPLKKHRIVAQYHGHNFESMFGMPEIFPLRY